MLLDLSKPFEAKKAQTKLSQLIEKGAKIELTEKKAMRSVKQNSYLHAILTTLYSIIQFILIPACSIFIDINCKSTYICIIEIFKK